MASFKAVVIQANTNKKVWKTVNIVGGTTAPKHAKPVSQIPLAQKQPGKNAVYQDSGGAVKGLPYIFIANYSGPA